MMRTTEVFCLLIGVVAIAAGCAGIISPAHFDEDGPQSFQALMAQDLAIAACRCQRHAGPGGRDACWTAFRRKMSPGGVGGTACAPISEEFVCGKIRGPAGDSDGCVILRYDYVVSDKVGYLCTRDEAMAVEAAWYNELERRNKDRHLRKPDFSTPETDQMVRDLMADKPIELAPKRGVCTSS